MRNFLARLLPALIAKADLFVLLYGTDPLRNVSSVQVLV